MFKPIIGFVIAGALAVAAYKIKKKLMRNGSDQRNHIDGELQPQDNLNTSVTSGPPFFFGYVDD